MASSTKDQTGSVRDAVKKSGLYGLNVVARRLTSIVLLPVYTRYLTRADYGIMDLLDVTIHIVTLLFGLRRADSLLYFYSHAANDEERRRAISTSMAGSLMIGGVVAALGVLLAPRVSQVALGPGPYDSFIVLSFLTLLFAFPIESGLTLLRLENKVSEAVTLSSARMLAAAAVNVGLLVFTGLRVEAFLWANLVTSAALGLYLMGYVFRRAGFRLDLARFREDVSYSLPLALHGMAMLAVHYGDRMFLRATTSLSEIGLYALAYKIGMMVSYVHAMFDAYWRVEVFQILKKEDGREIYVRMSTYVMAVLTTFCVLLTVFHLPLVRIMAGANFVEAAQYVPALVLAYLARSIGDQMRVILRVRNQNWREVRITAVNVTVCVALYALLIPKFAVWGAVWATLLSFLTAAGMAYWECQQVEHFHYEYARLGKLALAAAAAIGLSLWAKPDGLAAQIGVGVLGAAVYAALLLAQRWATRDEIKAARRWVAALKTRLRLA